MRRVAIFGGSFDPIHIGHAMIANYLSQCGMIDELWLMPGRVNPLKADHRPAPDRHRLEMCRIVADRCVNVKVCDIEFAMPEPSYTCNTLSRLRELYPDTEFILLIGSDNWLIFDKWKNGDEILCNHRILIYPRPGCDVAPDSLPAGVTLLNDLPTAQISSTFIREGLKSGLNLNYLLPAAILDYIISNNLYSQ